MTRLPGILAGALLSVVLALAVAAQGDPQSVATISQAIPVIALVPVTLDDGTVQTVTVPLTVTLNVNVSVEGATTVGAEVEQASLPTPIAEEVTIENLADFLPALSDMPNGFKLIKEGAGSSNEELAESWPDPAAALEQFEKSGRLGSYNRDFQAAGLPLFGNARLSLSVVLFDSEQGAEDAMPLYRERDLAQIDKGEVDSVHEMSIPILGQSRDAYVLSKAPTDESSMNGLDAHNITFRKGDVLAFVHATSLANVGDIDQLLELARMIEQRLP